MKLNFKLSINQLNELAFSCNELLNEPFIKKSISYINRINTVEFIKFCLQKNLIENNKTKIKTIKIDVNYFESIEKIFLLNFERINQYAQSIFLVMFENKNK